MKKKFFTVRTIFGCFCILFSFYMLFTTQIYNGSSCFNYRILLAFLTFLILGIVQIFQRNKPVEKKRFWPIFWAILVAAFTILIVTVVSQKKQIEKLRR